MKVNHLAVTDYRNIEHAAFTPGPELTVLVGANGQGKTNLLESIWLLTGGKSFRGSKDVELIRRGAPFAVVEAAITAQERDQEIRLVAGPPGSPRPGRTVHLNGVDRKRAANIAGTFTAVVFDPGHLSLVKGSPAGRRKFLDTALCQLYPEYLSTLRRYARLVTQKNALLKHFMEAPDGRHLLEVFNADLARCGEEVTRRRLAYMEKLAPEAASNYRDISRGSESLALRYLSTHEEKTLKERLDGIRETEIRAGFCLVGPHRDDIEITLSDQPARVYGSQGQQRSAVLSLKLAEASLAADIMGEHPVMLLDDVLSELDDDRQSYLLTRMEGKQTFVTSCDSAAFARTDGQLVQVKNGCTKEF